MTTVAPETLQRMRDRDPATLASIVNDHSLPLYRAALAMGVQGDVAEDLVQDTLLTFLSTLDRFEGRAQIRTWLFGILYHKLFEVRRDLARVEQHDPIDDVFESKFDANGSWIKPPADIQRLLESEEAGIHIQACVESLPPIQRSAFRLREIEGLASKEICELLGLSPSNFGVLMHRARTRLRECLESRGIHQ